MDGVLPASDPEGHVRSLRWLVLLLPVLAACSCEETVSNAAGEVTAVPQAVEFGGVFVGEEGEQQVLFKNGGATAVTLAAPNMPATFAVKPATLQIAPGGQASWTFVFAPEVVGEAAGEAMLVVSGARNKELAIQLKGEGLARDVNVTDLDFGLVPVGETKSLPLPIGSGSAATLTAEITLEGSDSDSFAIQTTRLEIPAGESADLQVSFTPLSRSMLSARLLIKTCSDCRETRVSLTGEGAQADLRPLPSTVDFGLVHPGSSVTKTIRLSNSGNLPVLVGSASLDPEGGPNFVVDASAFPVEVGAGEDVVVEVSFQPPADAAFTEQTSSVRFYGADENALHFSVPLSGRPGGPNLVATPAQINFGDQPLGLRVSSVVTVRNVGEPATARVIDAYVEGGDSAAFSVELPETMPADVGTDVAAFTVSFNGPNSGIKASQLVIITDDDEQPQFRVPLQGNVRDAIPCDIVVQPGAMRFGLVANGGDYTKTIEVINRGTEDCLVWDVQLDQSRSPFFAPAGVPTGTAVIPPNGRLPLTIRFMPQGLVGVKEETTLSFSHSAPNEPRKVIPVSGLPSRYDLRVTPSPVMFGALPIDFRSFRNVTLTNHGIFPATVISANPSLGTSAEFDVHADQLGAIGAEGGTSLFRASYAPAQMGPDAGELELWIQEANEPIIFGARGIGTDEECGDLCAPPTAICPAPQTTNVNNQVVLIGTGTDPAGDSLNCTWAKISGPSGSREGPANAALCNTTFTPDMVGDYEIELTVSDAMGNTDSCTTQVHANPFGGLWVEMYWSINGDIDLHMLHPNAGTPNTRPAWIDPQWACFYGNCRGVVEWDNPGPNDNPSLDRDDIQQTGPENIRINQPSTTHPYVVGFKNFSNSNMPQVTYNVYCGGALVNPGNNTFASPAVGSWINGGEVLYSSTGPCTFTPSGATVSP